MPDLSAYVICTTPRSGSTLLCRMLAATGVAGDPQSYFHAASVERWAESLGVTRTQGLSDGAHLAEVFAAATTAGRARTGLFGLRLQAPSLAFLRDRLAVLHPQVPTDRARIEAAFGPTRFLHLHRASKLDQAISRLKAEQTGLWHGAPDGRDIERQGAPADPVYDADALRDGIAQAKAWDRVWDDFFARERIAPYRIDYDTLATDPHGTVRRLLKVLGCDPNTAEGLKVPTRKLADAISVDWARQYRTDQGRA